MLSNAAKKGGNIQKINDAHERIKTYDSRSIECEKRFVQLEERKADGRAFEEIKLDLEIIKRSIDPKHQLFIAQSPLKLTDLGKKVAADAGIYDSVDANWNAILRLVNDGVKSTNPYDMQQVCFDLSISNLEAVLLPEEMDRLKTYAYNTGNSILYYSRVVGIVIRDKYFESKGMDIFERDRHDPSKQ
jgi:hypothetical protein